MNPWEHILLSVEVSLVVEMAKVGIMQPSSCTPHARLRTKRTVVKCNYCERIMDALDKIAEQPCGSNFSYDETFLPDLMYGS